MFGGHMPSSRLRHSKKGLRVDPQADRLDRSDSLVGFEQEREKQLLPSRIGEVPRIVLGGPPDRVDERVNPTQPIKVPLLEGDQGGSARHGKRRVSRFQYSSASMIVSTLVVTDGSAGSSEWPVIPSP